MRGKSWFARDMTVCRQMVDPWRHAGAALLVAATMMIVGGADPAPATPAATAPATFPRFASLKVDRVAVRQGPGGEHPVVWTFQRAGLPVELLREQGGWVEIRDVDGSTGWMQRTLVSGRRTVLVRAAPGRTLATVLLRRDTSVSAPIEAELESGIIATVLGCDGRWCRLSVGGTKGWLEQSGLWGVYASELVRP